MKSLLRSAESVAETVGGLIMVLVLLVICGHVVFSGETTPDGVQVHATKGSICKTYRIVSQSKEALALGKVKVDAAIKKSKFKKLEGEECVNPGRYCETHSGNDQLVIRELTFGVSPVACKLSGGKWRSL